MADSLITVIWLGDIVGSDGREAVCALVPGWRKDHAADLVLANGENASGGTGIVPASVSQLRAGGVDVISLGDHVWKHKELQNSLAGAASHCIRPANYPPGAPGQGWLKFTLGTGLVVGVFNLLGRVFIPGALDCPFRTIDELLAGPLADAELVIGDMHAEATSEKLALARYLDGRISLLVGTHTHVPTADAQILSRGTGYITDLGMCGSQAGVLGMDTTVALKRFLSGRPAAYKLACGSVVVSGIVAKIDLATKRTTHIEPLRQAYPG